jgi:hypothetical protein
MDTEFRSWKAGKKKSKNYQEKSEIGRWNLSRWDHSVWGDSGANDDFEEILKLLFRNTHMTRSQKKTAMMPYICQLTSCMAAKYL